MRSLSPLLVLCAVSVQAWAAPPVFDRKPYAIPYEKHVLENGLTLLVHEDHSVPIVGVTVWYHVGSRNEVRGRTGFAHLFEHFFFNGSEHHPGGFREAMDDLGAVSRNGTTNGDRTSFYETVPVSALEKTLFLEADRMGFLAKQVNQAMLERERGVVSNELRQGENVPYGRVFNRMPSRFYPAEHPYSWPTIGSLEDLAAATLEDVQEWYRTYYGPGNCVIALTGDIKPARALELTRKYFGDIPPGPPLARAREWVPRLDASRREEMQDRVAETRIHRFFHAPGVRDADVERLRLFTGVLSGSPSARLDRRLVHELEIATQVEALVWDAEIASVVILMATVKAGVDPARVEAEMDHIVAELVARGPTDAELARARSRFLARHARALERLGGFGGRGEILTESMTYFGRPDAYLDGLERLATTTAAEVRAAARRWLDAPSYTLVVVPFPEAKPAPVAVDRAKVPPLGEAPDVTFPAVQRAKLKNGLEVILLERHGAPLVNMTLAVDAGHASDAPGHPGVASLALDLLDRGTAKRDFFKIADDLDALGATVTTSTNLDHSMVRLRALAPKLRPSLDLFAEIVLSPTFPSERVVKEKKLRLAGIAQERSSAEGLGLRLLPALLYGQGHPYGVPFSGTGDEAAIRAVTRADLARWHAESFKPGSARLIVAGDVTLPALLPELERVFAGWSAGRGPERRIPPAPRAAGKKLYLVDRPDSPQSVIFAAHVTEPGGRPDDVAAETVMRALGGMSTARLNRNLRLEKHWSYGAGASIRGARGPRPLLMSAGVQTDKTAESVAEVLKEVADIAGRRPLRGEELASILRTQTLGLPGRFSTLSSLEEAALDMVRYGYPDDWFPTYARRVRALDEKSLGEAARQLIHPDDVIVMVIGDLKKFEPKLRAMGGMQVVVLDAAGAGAAREGGR